jgi:hypothetical protein
MMDEHTNRQISGMISNVFNPLLMISSAAGAAGLVSSDSLILVGLVALGMFLFFIVVGMLLTPLICREKSQRGLYQMMFVFSNLGFIGIPVVSSIVGSEYVVYVTEFMLVYTIVIYTYGMAVLDGKFSLSSMKAMLNPGTICGVIAIVIIAFGIQVPAFLKTAVTYLGNVASPMALILVGFTLAHSDLKQIFREPRHYAFAAVKLLILPLIALPVLKLLVADDNVRAVCLIMFAMPAGNMPLILANQKGINGEACSRLIILTTVLCVFTVPVLMTFL